MNLLGVIIILIVFVSFVKFINFVDNPDNKETKSYKVFDQFIQIFVWVYSIFLYSLILPLLLGIIILFIYPSAFWLRESLMQLGDWQWLVLFVLGYGIKRYREKI